MNPHSTSRRNVSLAVAVALAAAAIGVLQSVAPTEIALAAQASSFVQSEGAVPDTQAGLPSTAHAQASGASPADLTRF